MAAFTLNVLIHGMHLIDFGDHNVMLYPPKVPKDAHTYMAGTWMQEKKLAEGGTYRLTGFTRQTKTPLPALHPDRSAVFHRTKMDLSPAYCSIEVPFPNATAMLLLTPQRPGTPFFPDAAGLYQAPSAVPDVIVLTYHNVSDQIRLEPLGWTPTAQNGYANLHIWAVPPGPTPPGHPAEEMQVLGQMMGYPGLRMDTSYKEQPAPPADLATGVPGVPPNEELSIFERQATGEIEPRVTSAFDCLATIVY